MDSSTCSIVKEEQDGQKRPGNPQEKPSSALPDLGAPTKLLYLSGDQFDVLYSLPVAAVIHFHECGD